MKRLLFTILSAFVATACVNKEYDLDKLNTEMNLFSEEGIEIPFPIIEKPVSFDIFSINQLREELLSIDTDSIIKKIDLSKEEPSNLEKGIKLNGEFRFDLSKFPKAFRNEGTELKFDEGSFFSILVESDVSIPVSFSFDVFNGATDTLIGQFTDFQISTSQLREIQIPFGEIDMTCLPETIVIKNVVVKSPTPIARAVTGTIKFVNAVFKLKSKLKKGSIFVYDYEFMDLYKELGININDFNGYLDAQSFVIKSVLTTNLPVSLSGKAKGGIDATLSFDGPTPDEGVDFNLVAKCPEGLLSIKHVNVCVTCRLNDDLELTDAVKLKVKLNPVCIKFDKGIIVRP